MTLINLKSKKGFIMIFAVAISGIVAAIALGIANITFKELSFTTSARNANEAFYAADIGAECALFNDKQSEAHFPLTGPATTIDCADVENIPVNFSSSGGVGTYNFELSGLGNSSQACAKVIIQKQANGNTIITSKGYNIGDATCESTNPNRVERKVVLTFDEIAAAPLDIEYLIVGGGGGGGQSSVGFGILLSGGGGAGGLLTGSSNSLVVGTPYNVTVGSGGGPDGNGTSSSIETLGTANGGGRGGAYNASVPTPCASGGSGGGASGYSGSGCAGTSGQGNSGGRAGTAGNSAGGGGGAGGLGQNGSDVTNGQAAAGGSGIASSISGNSVTYAVGGSTYAVQATTPGSGGGGATAGNAGSGRNGIVIIRLPDTQISSCTNCATSTSGGYTTHTFTGNGTFTP